MKTLKKILVPVDLSEATQGAIEYAGALAAQYGSEVVFLHVITEKEADLIATSHVPRAPIDEVFSELKQRLYGQILTETPALLAESRKAEIEISMGEPEEAILAVANRIDADLIVMGTHGRTGLSHLLMGSVAEHVIRSALCPVLTVKAGELVPKAA